MVLMLPDRPVAPQPDSGRSYASPSFLAAEYALPSLLAPSALLCRAGVARRENSAAALQLAGAGSAGRERRRPGRIAPAGPARGLRERALDSVTLPGGELTGHR